MALPPNEQQQAIDKDTHCEVNAKISSSMHPDNLANVAGILVDGSPGVAGQGYGAARQALRALHLAAVDIDNAHSAMLHPMAEGVPGHASANGPVIEMAIPPEKTAELSAAMASRASRAGAQVERADQKIAETMQALEETITRATKHPTPDRASIVQEASEIRTYVKNLPSGKRMSFLHDACDRGELNVVSAVIHASPWVSGITPSEQQLIVGFARDAFAPRELNQAKALAHARGKIDEAMSAFKREYSRRLPKVIHDPGVNALRKLREAA